MRYFMVGGGLPWTVMAPRRIVSAPHSRADRNSPPSNVGCGTGAPCAIVEAAERTLLTAIANGASPAALTDLLLGAATDRAFADGGHTLDFINKACECLDLIGWDHAAAVLPSAVGQMVAARGAEETTAWRHPVDLVALCEEAAVALPDLLKTARRSDWSEHAELSAALLGDDARAIVQALKAAVRAGASPADLGRSLAYAAALRVARFGTANEHGDWETALHVFTYANALHQALKRIAAGDGSPGRGVAAVRGILHGAMAVYLARYLNVPPARLPGEGGDRLDDLPDDLEDVRDALLRALAIRGLPSAASFVLFGSDASPVRYQPPRAAADTSSVPSQPSSIWKLSWVMEEFSGISGMQPDKIYPLCLNVREY